MLRKISYRRRSLVIKPKCAGYKSYYLEFISGYAETHLFFIVLLFQIPVNNYPPKGRYMNIDQSINPILIRVYPRKRGWPDLTTISPTAIFPTAIFPTAIFPTAIFPTAIFQTAIFQTVVDIYIKC